MASLVKSTKLSKNNFNVNSFQTTPTFERERTLLNSSRETNVTLIPKPYKATRKSSREISLFSSKDQSL